MLVTRHIFEWLNYTQCPSDRQTICFWAIHRQSSKLRAVSSRRRSTDSEPRKWSLVSIQDSIFWHFCASFGVLDIRKDKISLVVWWRKNHSVWERCHEDLKWMLKDFRAKQIFLIAKAKISISEIRGVVPLAILSKSQYTVLSMTCVKFESNSRTDDGVTVTCFNCCFWSPVRYQYRLPTL